MTRRAQKIHQTFFRVTSELRKSHVAIELPNLCVISYGSVLWQDVWFFPDLKIVVCGANNSTYQVQRRSDNCWYYCTTDSQVYQRCVTEMPASFPDGSYNLLSSALTEALNRRVENIILEEE